MVKFCDRCGQELSNEEYKNQLKIETYDCYNNLTNKINYLTTCISRIQNYALRSKNKELFEMVKWETLENDLYKMMELVKHEKK